jgi:hypothetical protein
MAESIDEPDEGAGLRSINLCGRSAPVTEPAPQYRPSREVLVGDHTLTAARD